VGNSLKRGIPAFHFARGWLNSADKGPVHTTGELVLELADHQQHDLRIGAGQGLLSGRFWRTLGGWAQRLFRPSWCGQLGLWLRSVRSSWSIQPGDGPAWLGARANPGAGLLQKLKKNWSCWWSTCPHFDPEWQKLAFFRRGQKCPKIIHQARIYYFRNKCVAFARNCKFANLTKYNMQ